MSVCALIAAAGSGRRMRMKGNKTHLLLRGKPILIHTLSAFQACQAVDDVILIVASDEIELTWGLIRAWGGFSKVRKVVSGGATRQESVLCGLGHIEPECEIVVIHDCARPLIRPSTIEMTIEAAREYGAAIVSVPMRDTIKVDQEGYVAETPERDLLRAARTPQAFQREIIEKAYISAAEEGFIATDDSMVVERLGVKVRLLDDELDNIKITYEEDLVIADSYLSRRSLEDERGILKRHDPEPGKVRVGTGFDVHRLVEGRPLILGGVDIPFELGLEGHSDADVVLHAVSDAILGACALGDIGILFPPDDPSYEGISSDLILAKVKSLAESQGYTVENVDITVLAEKPRISRFAGDMRRNISRILGIGERDIGIKATTMEGLGFIGAGEGIACFASCSLVSRPLPYNVGGIARDSQTNYE